jgi:glycosyltransferase involved in cell wall biosynthesis
MVIPNQCKLAILATHPIHYQIQLFKRLAQIPRLNVTVLFCSRFGLSPQVDHTCGIVHQWYDEAILDGLPHKFLPNYSWEGSRSTIFGTMNPGVVRELTLGRYDVLLVQGYAGLTEWLALAMAKAVSCRVLFRGETGLRPGPAGKRDVIRKMTLKALARAVEVFLPIGTRSRDFYLHYGIPPHRLVLSPYAVDNDFFCEQARLLQTKKAQLRAALGIDPTVPVVLYVSKMTARKRPLDLVQAFEKLTQPAVLLMVGDGPLRPSIENYAARRNMRMVIMAGFQKQDALPQFYAIGDIFVLPSEYEPWGLVVNEAMSFALPIMTTHGVAAAADLVSKENGVVYEPGDIDSLAAALQQLVQHKDQRAAMGKRSAEIIRDWNLDASATGICQGIAMAQQ